MSITDDVLASGSLAPVCEVTSWLDGKPLGVVPITQGDVTEAAGGDSLARVEITLPATDEWLPRGAGHALSPFGQELLIRRGFRLHTGEVVGWEILGRFRILTTEPEDGWLTVVAESIDIRLELARWIVTTTTTGTLAEQCQQVCAGIVPIRIDVPDRPSVDRTWDDQESRRDALLELCDALGAVLRMIDGQLVITAISRDETPTATVISGDGGTLVEVSPERLSDPAPNIVVASSASSDELAPTVTAMAITPSGPRAWDGPYGQVIAFYGSPVIRTVEQAQRAAETRLLRMQSKAADVRVVAVTDPRTRLDSVRRVVDTAHGVDVVVRVVEVTHALTPGKEPGGFRGVYVSGVIEGPPMVPVPPVSKPYRSVLRPTLSGNFSGKTHQWEESDVLMAGQKFNTWVSGFGQVWWGVLPTNIVSAVLYLERVEDDMPVRVLIMRLVAPLVPGLAPESAEVVALVNGPTPAQLPPGEVIAWPVPQEWVDHLNAGTAGGMGIGNGTAGYSSVSASGLGMTLALTLSI